MSHISSRCPRKSRKNRTASLNQPAPKRFIRPGLTAAALVGLAAMFAVVTRGVLFVEQLGAYPAVYGLFLR